MPDYKPYFDPYWPVTCTNCGAHVIVAFEQGDTCPECFHPLDLEVKERAR